MRSSLLALVVVAAPLYGESPGKPEVGKPAPAIKLEATQIDKALPDYKDAKTLSLADLKGKKNVVKFFTIQP